MLRAILESFFEPTMLNSFMLILFKAFDKPIKVGKLFYYMFGNTSGYMFSLLTERCATLI